MIPVPSGHAIVPVDHIVKGLEEAYKSGYHKGVMVGIVTTLVGVEIGRRMRRRGILKMQRPLKFEEGRS